MNDYTDYPDELTEKETLVRLTIEEKRRLARVAILEFPHLDYALLDEWLCRYGVNSATTGASLQEKTEALLDECETLVRSGEEPEALDHFIYGYGSVKISTVDTNWALNTVAESCRITSIQISGTESIGRYVFPVMYQGTESSNNSLLLALNQMCLPMDTPIAAVSAKCE